MRLNKGVSTGKMGVMVAFCRQFAALFIAVAKKISKSVARLVTELKWRPPGCSSEWGVLEGCRTLFAGIARFLHKTSTINCRILMRTGENILQERAIFFDAKQ